MQATRNAKIKSLQTMRNTIKEFSSPTTPTSSGQDIQAHLAHSDGDITATIRSPGEANLGPTKTVQPPPRPIRRPHTPPPGPACHPRVPTATGCLSQAPLTPSRALLRMSKSKYSSPPRAHACPQSKTKRSPDQRIKHRRKADTNQGTKSVRTEKRKSKTLRKIGRVQMSMAPAVSKTRVSRIGGQVDSMAGTLVCMAASLSRRDTRIAFGSRRLEPQHTPGFLILLLQQPRHGSQRRRP